MQNSEFKIQNAELCLFVLFCQSVCTLALTLHRRHILCLAEVETHTHIDICRGDVLWNRNRFSIAIVRSVYRIASVDKVGTYEEVKSRWVKVECTTQYSWLVSVEECVADRGREPTTDAEIDRCRKFGAGEVLAELGVREQTEGYPVVEDIVLDTGVERAR